MSGTERLSENPDVWQKLEEFIQHYGTEVLLHVLEDYRESNSQYICGSGKSMVKLQVNEILYLDIYGHHITVHTAEQNWEKYGSLSQELELLGPLGFMKCTQSILVSLKKVRQIMQTELILDNGERLPVSRRYLSGLRSAYLAEIMPKFGKK